MDNENEKVNETPAFDPCAPAPKKEKKAHPVLRTIALVLVCVLLGGAAGVGGTVYMNKYYQSRELADGNTEQPVGIEEPEVLPEPAAEEPAPVEESKLLTAAQVFKQNVDSTVGITTSVTVTNFWGYTTTSPASGSGLILTEDGYILTNYHVIEDSDSVTVSTYSGESYEAAIVGFDKSSDVAVLKIEAEGLKPAVLGKSGELSVGDYVVAIGNPLGELTFTMTQGIVSALDRTVTLSNGVNMKLIQTDCAINSGNSGGALFNLYGEVIGITNAKFSSSSSGASIDNIGFAIPIDKAKPIIESIIEKGYVSKPYIGVSILAVSEETQAFGLPAGIAVQEVVEGGPADLAGIQVYDIITAVNGAAVTENIELTEAVSRCLPGDTILFEVYRQGETLEIAVTVGENISTPETGGEEGQTQQDGEENAAPSGDVFGDYFDYFGDLFGNFGF